MLCFSRSVLKLAVNMYAGMHTCNPTHRLAPNGISFVFLKKAKTTHILPILLSVKQRVVCGGGGGADFPYADVTGCI